VDFQEIIKYQPYSVNCASVSDEYLGEVISIWTIKRDADY